MKTLDNPNAFLVRSQSWDLHSDRTAEPDFTSVNTYDWFRIKNDFANRIGGIYIDHGDRFEYTTSAGTYILFEVIA